MALFRIVVWGYPNKSTFPLLFPAYFIFPACSIILFYTFQPVQMNSYIYDLHVCLKYNHKRILIRMNNYIIILIRMNNFIKNTNEDEFYRI